MVEEASLLIGIDLSDPFAKRQRPCTRAILWPDLQCKFDDWTYDETGFAIVPPDLTHLSHIVAIDGPQGLAGSQEQRMRLCEKQLGAASKSPYDFPPIGRPYAGFICGLVKLFYSLHRSVNFCLHGMHRSQQSNANLIEVYPGSAWPVLAGGHRLEKKALFEGRKTRHELLVRQGLNFTERYRIESAPTHDQLDAAMAAYIAYLFRNGKTKDCGRKPYEDTSLSILREGLIVQPAS